MRRGIVPNLFLRCWRCKGCRCVGRAGCGCECHALVDAAFRFPDGFMFDPTGEKTFPEPSPGGRHA